MRTNLRFEESMAKTSGAFWRVVNTVYPDKAHRFEPVEGTDGKTYKALDAAGIDWLYHSPDGLIGISQRTQTIRRGLQPYNTFTVRVSRVSGYDTEWQKLVKAVSSNTPVLMSYVTIQSFFSEDESLLSSGVIKTRDLITSLLAGPPMRYYTNPQDGTKFVAPSWESLQSNGCPVKIWTPPLALAA